MRLKLLLCTLLLGVGAMATTLRVGAQSSTPTRLLQQADLVYQGSFTFANTTSTCWVGTEDWNYVQGVIGFNPANQSLFMVGHGVCQQVAEFKIPALGGVAPVLQGSKDVTDGHLGDINPSDPNSKSIGGLYVIGDRLVATGYSTYDGGGSAIASHFVRSTNFASGGATGPFRVGDQNPAFYAGYFAPVPAAWQGPLGGAVLNGQCCLSIISRTSFGPSVSVVNPADLVAARNPTPAKMLIGYPAGHTTLGDGTTQGPLFNVTTQVRGVVLPEGTASVLFFGRHGLGTYCYGEVPTDCQDPSNSYKGGHAYPYEPHVWAYDANQLADVQAGRKQPWEVVPYATWRLPSEIRTEEIGGVATDPATGRIFILENYGNGDRPRAHVLTISGSAAPADTTPPTVSLTGPSLNAILTGNVTLSATATDNVGVTSVWFTVDGTAVGTESTSTPYQTSWNSTSVANLVHVVRAVARDAAGNVATSAGVSVTVTNLVADNTAPTVAVTAPANGASVSGAVTLTATASDVVGVVGVRFTVDGANVGAEDTTAPYGVTWSTTNSNNGLRAIRAIARDAAGNVTTSSAVSVTVANTPSDNTLPAVSVSAPASGATVKGTVTVSATATDNTAIAGVQFALDGTAVGVEDVTAPYSIAWNTTGVSNGSHSLRAVARDTAGNISTSGSIIVTVNNTSSDTTLPTVSLTAPANFAGVSGTTTVSASASDNVGIAGVQFTLDGINLGSEDKLAPFSITWNTVGASNGTHTLRAVARDAAGNLRTSTSRTVIVSNYISDTFAPTVNLTVPAANATVAGALSLTATAVDDVSMGGVQFAVDGVNLGAEDTSAPYTRSWDAGRELNGPHVITATARDAAGNRRTATANVTVRNLGSGIAGDLNDDGLPDLLFEHVNGQLYSWMMRSGTMVGEAVLAPSAVNPVWRIVAVDDFNGDRKTDILWQNSVNGQVYLWLMDQQTLIGEASILAEITEWQVIGTADLNGDNKPDIIWKLPSTGQLAVWYMDGATFTSGSALNPTQVDSNWRLAGTADMNLDGRSDLIWQNRATGQLVCWLMNGASAAQIVGLTPGATAVLWEVRAIADFDGDGNADLIFQHATTGQLYVWYLNGTTLVRSAFVSPSQVDPAWRVVGGK